MERLIKIGKIIPKNSADIKSSALGLGFEKLDRNVFDPEKAYDKVSELGVKWIRIQSGWARTEKEKGVYDFAWLDSIVDNLTSRNLIPWVCLCYGNALYDEKAQASFGAVGCPPIFTEEQKTAWTNYVKAITARYKDKIKYWEVWNEPDGCGWNRVEGGPDASALGQFTIDTAKAVKAADPDAKVIGGCLAYRSLSFLSKALETGMADYIDAISFHLYTASEVEVIERCNALAALSRKYNPNLKMIQGEGGTQSKSGGSGAMYTGGWTERKQAKFLLRLQVSALSSEVLFSSYFSCLDMIEALNGTVGDKASYLDYGYFGVLGADFDSDGMSTGEYTPKPSYYAYQNLCSIFCNEVKPANLPVMLCPSYSDRIYAEDFGYDKITSMGFKKPDGSSAYAYWYPNNYMMNDFEGTVTLEIAGESGEIHLVDLYDGSVYNFPENLITRTPNCIKLNHIPIKDYPMLITIGDFADFK